MTPLQELKKKLFDVRIIQNPLTLKEMNEFLEKEKQMIIDAYGTGYSRALDRPLNYITAEQYYNEKYKQ